MSKKIAILLVVTVFFIGATLGFLVGGTFVFKIASQKYEKEAESAENRIVISSEIRNAGDAIDSIHILNLLRTNNTAEGIEELEGNLDMDLIGLSASMSNAPKSQFDPSFQRAFQKAKEYRLQFPHRNSELWVNERLSNVLFRTSASVHK